MDKLLELISYVESDNFLYAIRFEEDLYLRLNSLKYIERKGKILEIIKDINKCSFDTAKMIFSCSWGKYQIMGFNLYSTCGLDKTIAEFLCNSNLQDKCAERFLNVMKIDASKVLSDIESLTHVKKDLKNRSKNLSEFTLDFKTHLVENKNEYHDIIRFIEKYNGSRFISDSFYFYLLRILHKYETKIAKN